MILRLVEEMRKKKDIFEEEFNDCMLKEWQHYEIKDGKNEEDGEHYEDGKDCEDDDEYNRNEDEFSDSMLQELLLPLDLSKNSQDNEVKVGENEEGRQGLH